MFEIKDQSSMVVYEFSFHLHVCLAIFNGLVDICQYVIFWNRKNNLIVKENVKLNLKTNIVL